ncbi:RNA polymerase II-associated protein 3 [Chytridiales sp. JEL 0842]|nr:RNA polymerase II-associated protein 3 [Chytridiales sp. JEL 0842]
MMVGQVPPTSAPASAEGHTKQKPPVPRGPDEVALQIRQNALEYKEYVNELLNWEKEIKSKDKEVQQKKKPVPVRQSVSSSSTLPIRSTGVITTNTDVPGDSRAADAKVDKATTSGKVSSKPAAKRIASNDYRAWDKLDIDKMLDEVDSEQKEQKPVEDAKEVAEKIAEMANQREKEIAEAESRLEKALIEKEKGNEYFKRAEFKKAVNCYNRSIALDPTTAVVPINRAMAHIKLGNWSLAESDCTIGLSIEPKNVKALWRRGIARRELGKLSEAKADLELAAVLEPSNKFVKEELSRVMALLPKSSNDGKKGNQGAPTKPRQRRIEIVEVGNPQDFKEDPEIDKPLIEPIKSTAVKPSEKVEKPQPKDNASTKAPSKSEASQTSGKVPKISKVAPSIDNESTRANVAAPIDSSETKRPEEEIIIKPKVNFAPPKAVSPKPKGTPIRPPGTQLPVSKSTVSEVQPSTANPTKPETLNARPSSPLINLLKVVEEKPDSTEAKASEVAAPEVVLKQRKPLVEMIEEVKPTEKKPTSPTRENSKPKVESSPPRPAASFVKYVAPTSMFEFERDWKTLKSDSGKLYQYFKAIPPQEYTKIFKNSMESHYLTKILDILKTYYIKYESPLTLFTALKHLSKVQRFDMNMMFLSRAEKAGVTSMMEHLKGALVSDPGFSEADMSALQKSYK